MNKKRTTIWLSQDVMDRLDEMTKTDDSKSRSEFIERAIKFYDGYNRSTLENQYLPVAISSAVQGTVKSSEDRISKLLYKNTVELSMVMNVLSAIADVDNDTLKKLRVKCMNEVKATHGKISFEDINKYFGIIGSVEAEETQMTRNEDEYLKPKILYKVKVEKGK